MPKSIEEWAAEQPLKLTVAVWFQERPEAGLNARNGMARGLGNRRLLRYLQEQWDFPFGHSALSEWMNNAR